MKPVLPSVLGAIGQTPLVRLDRLVRHYDLDGTLFAKLDYLNPGFSKKDRAALGVIEQAEKSGALKPGQTVVELTSGNMGTGLAIVCAIKGYRFIAVMSEGNSPERARMMRALGAEVVLVPQALGSRHGEVSGADLDLVEAEAHRIVENENAFRADQFHHKGNPQAHEDGTAIEIWQQTKGQLDAFVDFVGSGGTLAGVARALQPKGVRCYAAEPDGAAILSGKALTQPNHPIQGGGYARRDLKFLKDITLDGYVTIDGETAKKTARELACLEGIFAGFSAGANAAAALKLLDGPHKGKAIAIMICDSGLKYLSTDLWPLGLNTF